MNEEQRKATEAQFGRMVIGLLYRDQDTQEMSGENTLPQDSCADFVQECEETVSLLGLYPRELDE